jgi:hypothetical protein
LQPVREFPYKVLFGFYLIRKNMFAYRKLVAHLRVGSAFGLLWLLCVACGSESGQERTTTVDSSQAETSLEPPAALAKYSPKFQQIVRTPDGVLRGVSVGDGLDEVKQQERNAPSEDSTNYIVYNIKLGNDEETDVFYYYSPDNNTVQNIKLDVYLNDAQSVDSLMQEFNRYFTDKYGQPVTREAKTLAWQDGQKTRIVLKDVGIPQAPGLQVQIADGKATP